MDTCTRLLSVVSLSLWAACSATPAENVPADMSTTPPDLTDPSFTGCRMGSGAAPSSATCMPLATDYQPGKTVAGWPTCVSDGNTYVPINANISTVARIAAFEEVAKLLWECDKVPTAQDFNDAKVQLNIANGLQSRLDRREDEHYPPFVNAMGQTLCTDSAQNQNQPSRCVGPVRMVPILNAAFLAGSMGQEPRVNAAKIEGTLLWFLYSSVYKEAVTCGTATQDCDSSWAYYSGGEARANPGKGLMRYVKVADPSAHGRVYDATLATRCWRDADMAVPPANTTLQTRAYGQLDRALDRALAVVAMDRLGFMKRNTGERKAADWAFSQLVVGALDRAARAKDTTAAARLTAEVQKADPAAVQVDTLIQTLQQLFPCG